MKVPRKVRMSGLPVLREMVCTLSDAGWVWKLPAQCRCDEDSLKALTMIWVPLDINPQVWYSPQTPA